jgi:hypothetical protein
MVKFILLKKETSAEVVLQYYNTAPHVSRVHKVLAFLRKRDQSISKTCFVSIQQYRFQTVMMITGLKSK